MEALLRGWKRGIGPKRKMLENIQKSFSYNRVKVRHSIQRHILEIYFGTQDTNILKQGA